MVFDSDAIVDPRAMMIISFDTLLTNGTVSASSSPDDLALWAEIGRVDVSHELQERSVVHGLQLTRVKARCEKEGDDDH